MKKKATRKKKPGPLAPDIEKLAYGVMTPKQYQAIAEMLDNWRWQLDNLEPAHKAIYGKKGRSREKMLDAALELWARNLEQLMLELDRNPNDRERLLELLVNRIPEIQNALAFVVAEGPKLREEAQLLRAEIHRARSEWSKLNG